MKNITTFSRSVFWFGVLVLTGCASTRVIESWKNPDQATPLNFKRVLVAAIVPDEATRRIAEDQLVQYIGNNKAVASHLLLKQEDLGKTEVVKAEVAKQGIDGLVTIRVTNVKQEINYVPGSAASGFHSPWDYYGSAWAMAYEPGYLTTDTVVRLETNIYSMGQAKLVWSGTSETFNPGNVKTEVKAYATAIRKQLQKDGLVP